MFRRLMDSEYSDQANELRGAKLYGSDNDKIGTIDDVIYDPVSRRARYAVVDSGGWLSSRRYLVPSDYIRSSADNPDEFYVNLTRTQIESLPEFKDHVLSSDDRFIEYESLYQPKWQSYGFKMPESHHPRFTRLESRISGHDVRPITTSSAASSVNSTSPVSVYSVYSDREKLEAAVQRLKDQGFNSSDISVVFPDKGRTERFAMEHNTKGPEGAVVGGGTGMAVGGVLGWLAGIGSLAIPGIGPLLAAGPIVAALAGAGAAGAVGGLAGGLIGLGIPELEAKRFEKEIREGRMLLSVRCTDPRYVSSARSVLESTGAKDVFQTGEKLAA